MAWVENWFALCIYLIIAIGSILTPHCPFYNTDNRESIISLRNRWWLTLVLCLEFVLFLVIFWIIDCVGKPINLETKGLIAVIRHCALPFFLFICEYFVIIISCGVKYWLLSSPNNYPNRSNPHFHIDPEKFTRPQSNYDWITFSAQNILPAGWGDVIPTSRISRLYTIGATLGGLAVIVLLINCIVITLVP